jgi:hypothetical protein
MPSLVELKQVGLTLELKGGTSPSKALALFIAFPRTSTFALNPSMDSK